MSMATHSPLSPLLPDTIMQVSTKSDQNLSVSCLNHLPQEFADICQIQDSGSGFFVNARNTIITGGNFVVSLSCMLYNN